MLIIKQLFGIRNHTVICTCYKTSRYCKQKVRSGNLRLVSPKPEPSYSTNYSLHVPGISAIRRKRSRRYRKSTRRRWSPRAEASGRKGPERGRGQGRARPRPGRGAVWSVPDADVRTTRLHLHFQCPQHYSPYPPLSRTLFTIAMMFSYFYWGRKRKRIRQADTGHQQRRDASEAGSFARAEIQRNSSGTVVGLRRALCRGCWHSPGSTPVRLGWSRTPPSRCEGTVLVSQARAALWRVRSAALGPATNLVSRRETGRGKGQVQGRTSSAD